MSPGGSSCEKGTGFLVTDVLSCRAVSDAHVPGSAPMDKHASLPMMRWWFLGVFAGLVLVILSGCANRPVVQTQVIEKPVPVYCQIKLPAECKDAYAIDRISTADSPLTINRAMRLELEERAVCEIKMRAAIQGCNTTRKGM